MVPRSSISSPERLRAPCTSCAWNSARKVQQSGGALQHTHWITPRAGEITSKATRQQARQQQAKQQPEATQPASKATASNAVAASGSSSQQRSQQARQPAAAVSSQQHSSQRLAAPELDHQLCAATLGGILGHFILIHTSSDQQSTRQAASVVQQWNTHLHAGCSYRQL